MKLPDVSRLTYDAKKHAYSLDGRHLQGVTSVLDGTSSKSNLIQWSANCAVDFIKDTIPPFNPEWETDELRIMRPHLETILEEARTAHTRKKESAGKKGTDTHALVEEYINQCLEEHGGTPKVYIMKVEYIQIQTFMAWAVDNVERFLAAEQKLFSEKHGFAGTADFVAIIDGKLTIGDLKTFPKMWSADPFVQAGAYSLCWKELTGEAPGQSVIVKMCDPEDPRIKKYGNSPFAVYPRYAMEEDEQMFLKRLEIYRYNQNFKSPD